MHARDFLCDKNLFCIVVWWLALLHHSKKVLDWNITIGVLCISVSSMLAPAFCSSTHVKVLTKLLAILLTKELSLELHLIEVLQIKRSYTYKQQG